MATVNPYLTFDGNCETVFNFYKPAFGKEFSGLTRFGEMPQQEGMPPLSEDMKNRVMHGIMKVEVKYSKLWQQQL